MKVLHVIPSVSERSGGPGHAIIPMCKSLQAQGADVMIATTDEGVSSSESGVANLVQPRNAGPETQNYKGVPTVFFPFSWGGSFKYSKPLAKWLNANVKHFDVVHIHAVFNHACIAAASACRKYQVPYIVRPLGTLDPWSMKQKALKKSLFWQLAGKRMMRASAAVHYTSNAEKIAAESLLHLNHGKVVPLGVDLKGQVDVNSTQPGKGSDLVAGRYVLVLSRLHPKKGLDILVDAFASLIENPIFQDWKLVLAGEGPDAYVKSLKHTVATKQAEENILFPGWLEGDEKDVVLRHAALLVLPSSHENFGLCVMEALAVGVPVLLSPQVNLADEVKEANAGWISEVDKAELGATLAAALHSEAERALRGKAGKELARNFTWDRVALSLTELYSTVSADQRV